MTKKAAHNSTYKKFAAQWLNEALCFVSTFAQDTILAKTKKRVTKNDNPI